MGKISSAVLRLVGREKDEANDEGTEALGGCNGSVLLLGGRKNPHGVQLFLIVIALSF